MNSNGEREDENLKNDVNEQDNKTYSYSNSYEQWNYEQSNSTQDIFSNQNMTNMSSGFYTGNQQDNQENGSFYTNNQNQMYQNNTFSNYGNQWNGGNTGDYNGMNQNLQYNSNSYTGYSTNSDGSPYGISALCVSIVSLLLSVCFGGYIGIISLIFGIVSIKRNERLKALGITGIVLSAIAVVVSLIVTILLVIGIFVKEEGMREYRDYYGTWNACVVYETHLQEAGDKECISLGIYTNLNND